MDPIQFFGCFVVSGITWAIGLPKRLIRNGFLVRCACLRIAEQFLLNSEIGILRGGDTFD